MDAGSRGTVEATKGSRTPDFVTQEDPDVQVLGAVTRWLFRESLTCEYETFEEEKHPHLDSGWILLPVRKELKHVWIKKNMEYEAAMSNMQRVTGWTSGKLGLQKQCLEQDLRICSIRTRKPDSDSLSQCLYNEIS